MSSRMQQKTFDCIQGSTTAVHSERRVKAMERDKRLNMHGRAQRPREKEWGETEGERGGG